MFNKYILNLDTLNRQDIKKVIEAGLESENYKAFETHDADILDLSIIGMEAFSEVNSITIDMNIFGMEAGSFLDRVSAQLTKGKAVLIKLINYVRNYFSVYERKRREIKRLYKKLEDALTKAQQIGSISTVTERVEFIDLTAMIKNSEWNKFADMIEFLNQTDGIANIEPKFSDDTTFEAFVDHAVNYIVAISAAAMGKYGENKPILADDNAKDTIYGMMRGQANAIIVNQIQSRTTEFEAVTNKFLNYRTVKLSMVEFLKQAASFSDVVLGVAKEEGAANKRVAKINADMLTSKITETEEFKRAVEEVGQDKIVANLTKSCGMVTKLTTDLHKAVIVPYLEFCKKGYKYGYDGLKAIPKELYNK